MITYKILVKKRNSEEYQELGRLGQNLIITMVMLIALSFVCVGLVMIHILWMIPALCLMSLAVLLLFYIPEIEEYFQKKSKE